ncbi:rhodopsin-like [Anneissia japonica]|uniref:rhodopsin-like n=1 Tax=Anneissia japonica TaxID=1529436 RepID=UPI001425927D|nr:rhodopsin-like [Anneissia japonica]
MHNYSYPEQEITAFLFADILYYAIVIPSVYIGNLATIILLSIVFRTRRKPADLLVAFMATNDFFLAICLCTPTLIATGRGEWFGKTYCYVYSHFYCWYLHIKFFIVILISVDRYIAVTKPFQYKVIVTERNISIMVVTYALVTCLVDGLAFFFTEPILMSGWFCSLRLWKESEDGENSNVGLAVFFNVLVVMGFVGICLMVFCNLSLIHVYRKKTNLAKSEKRFMFMMIVIVVAFLAVWLPHGVLVMKPSPSSYVKTWPRTCLDTRVESCQRKIIDRNALKKSKNQCV